MRILAGFGRSRPSLPDLQAVDAPLSAFPLSDADAASLLRDAVPETCHKQPERFFSELCARQLHASDTSVVTVAVLNSGEEVALKRVQLRDDAVLRSYVLMEVAMSVLHSPLPQMVDLRGVLVAQHEVWVVMEWMRLGSLGDVRALIELPERAVAFVAKQVALAVADLHARDRIHRDIKAQNILVNDDGSVKLTDFGWAMQRTQSHRTTRVAVGSMHWMAPEVHAEKEYDEKVDIWSLGITVFELAVGEPPFFDDDATDVAARILTHPTPSLPTSIHAPGSRTPHAVQWSDSIRDFVRVCTCKDPSARPSASQLLHHPFLLSAMSPGEWCAVLAALPGR